MGKYNSELANTIIEVFKEEMNGTQFEVIPVTDEITLRNASSKLGVDSRATRNCINGRKEVFVGIEADNDFGRYQIISIFHDNQPIGIFTFGVESKAIINNLKYVTVNTGIDIQYSFEQIFGFLPDHLIVPAYTQILPDYRVKIREVGFKAVKQTLNLLASTITNSVTELVAQGDGINIAKPRKESASVVRWASQLGLEQYEGVGGLPSVGPVFFKQS